MQITTIGLDIAKNVFQVHGIDVAAFRCAKRISTFLRSFLDLANSGVSIKARVASRASSCTSRGIFRQHWECT